MRNAKSIFGVALLAALIAILGVHRVLESPRSATRIVTRPVVVALTDVPEGGTIERANVTVTRWPLGTIPAGAVASIDSAVGRIARINIYKGEALMRGRLAANTP